MTTITIPKKNTKEKELVAISQEEYEKFAQWQKTIRPQRILKTFKPTPAQLRTLKRSREDYKRDKYITIDELKRRLDIKG